MTTLYTIILVGLLIALHELGHFTLAKLAGVKVLRYSVGFGPRLLAHRVGETEYLLSLIPLGGYVQLLNEPPRDPHQAQLDRGRSMAEISPLWKALVFAAGPCANLLLPFVLLPCVYLIGIEVPAYRLGPAEIGHVLSGSAASRAGVAAGDQVLRANGAVIANWQQLDEVLADSTEGPLVMQLVRDRRTLWIEVEGAATKGARMGMAPPLAAVIGKVYPASPAAGSGLRARDRVVAINGVPVTNWYMVSEAIENSLGQALALQVLRGGEPQTIEVVPELEGERYVVGVSVAQDMIRQQHAPLEALLSGIKRGGELIGMTIAFVADFLRGQVDAEQIGGPVAVFKMTGEAVEASWAEALFILAFLSIQLGILNLLPVPVLDGGQLLFLLPELLFRKPLPIRLREGLQGVGLMMVLGLMVLAFYNDISRLL